MKLVALNLYVSYFHSITDHEVYKLKTIQFKLESQFLSKRKPKTLLFPHAYNYNPGQMWENHHNVFS